MNIKVYVACPMNPTYRVSEEMVVKILRLRGYNVYFPAEYKVPDAWSLPNPEWGKAVFDHDIEALDAAEVVVLLYYGQDTATGAIWEAGYAFGKGKKVIVVEMLGGIKDSLMVFNGAYSVLQGEKEIEHFDLITGEPKFTNTEQI